MFNYQANHIIISLGMTLVLSWVMTEPIAFALPVLFYFGRECYQYFALKRTKRFDWGGTMPVTIANVLAFILTL